MIKKIFCLSSIVVKSTRHPMTDVALCTFPLWLVTLFIDSRLFYSSKLFVDVKRRPGMNHLTRNFLLLVLCIINGCSSISEPSKHNNLLQHDNFLIVDHLSDNEKETRFKWKDLMGKETTLDMDDDDRYANRWASQLINDRHWLSFSQP